jgi:hypothetical protein
MIINERESQAWSNSYETRQALLAAKERPVILQGCLMDGRLERKVKRANMSIHAVNKFCEDLYNIICGDTGLN